jgi:archaellum component FlaC
MRRVIAMTNGNSTDDSDGPVINQPDYDGLEDLIQAAQDALDDVRDIIDGQNNAVGAIRNSLEEVEDIIDDAQDEERPELLDEASAYVDDLQSTIRHLEDQVDYESDTERTVDRMNALDNRVEDLEDALEGSYGQIVVHVGSETFVPDEYIMIPREILREVDKDPNDYLLYYGPDADEGDDEITRRTEIDLREHNVFSLIPDEVGYGASSDTPEDGADLPAGLAAEIKNLREDYEVDVDTAAEPNFTHVIVRDFPVPSDAYNRDEADVMIRVPSAYPEQAPDWVYVEEGFRLENGDLPKKARTPETNNGSAVIEGWVSFSWHINNLQSENWIPYESDLRYYLESIIQGRLAQGD